jgi:hypothetical protein
MDDIFPTVEICPPLKNGSFDVIASVSGNLGI